MSIPFSMLEHAFVSVAVSILLDSRTMSHVVVPIPRVARRRLSVSIESIPIRFVIFPLTVINISVDVEKFSFSIRFVVFPLTDVLGSVGPDLSAEALADVSVPLSFIFDPILELD